jgi:glycerol transport system ATP-binding protein
MSLRLEGVTKIVGQETHLYPMDLELEAGALYVLLGPTTAGKTSLMRLMAGLDRPSSGRVVIDGRDVTGLSVRKRAVAMVYQQFINYPSFTVYDNIASPLRRAGLAREETDRRVREAAGMLHIEDLLDRLPSALSGGQQQRTALARALVKDCELLLLDEPLVNLDYKLREELRGELQDIFRRGGSTVIYATTEPLEALMLGGNTVVLDAGRVLQTGPTVEVYHNPATLRVGQVFSDPPMNLIDSRVENGIARLGESLTVPMTGHLRDLPPGPYRFGVRANHLFVQPRAADDLEIAATVELAEISGSETFIHAAHSGISWVVQEDGVHSLGLGESLRVYVRPGHLFAFDLDGRLVAAPERGAPAPPAQ